MCAVLTGSIVMWGWGVGYPGAMGRGYGPGWKVGSVAGGFDLGVSEVEGCMGGRGGG